MKITTLTNPLPTILLSIKKHFSLLILFSSFIFLPWQSLAQFTFAVYGDSRTGHDYHQAVVNQIVNKNPDFVLHTGDFVSLGSLNAEWTQFQIIASPLLSKTPPSGLSRSFFPSIGNHDLPITNYFSVFGMSDYYYSFNYQNFHFISLNSEQSYTIGSEQYNWLTADLDNAQNKNIIVFLHQPAYSSGTHGSTAGIINNLVPQFEEHKVRFVFSGHDHIYERTYPIYQGAINNENGIIYFVTGGGGAPLYAVTQGNWWTAKAESQYHFVYFQITGNRFYGTTINKDGNTIESFEAASSDIEDPAIAINSGATMTNLRQVTLSLSATNNPYQMIISENSDFAGSSWETYTTAKTYTLSEGDGTKNLYIKFRDLAENESEMANDSIVLDSTSPITSISPAAKTYNAIQEVSLSAQDNISGVDKIYYTTDGSAPTVSSVYYKKPFKITKNTAVKYFAKDLQGNSESVKTAKYKIKKAKFVFRRQNKHTQKIANKVKYRANDLDFIFSKLPKKLKLSKKPKYYLTTQQFIKYPPKKLFGVELAKSEIFKKYWRIKTNFDQYKPKGTKDKFKLKITFKYTDKEFKAFRKLNKEITEEDLKVKYYNSAAKTWEILGVQQNKKKNTLTAVFDQFLFSKMFFIIGL